MDGHVDYTKFTLKELREAEASIDPLAYPKNYENLQRAIRAIPQEAIAQETADRHKNPRSFEGPFEIISTAYRWFLWVVLVCILAGDLVSVVSMYIVGSTLSLPLKIIAALGICLKLAILGILVARKGPLEPLVYVWGGLMIVSGVTGLLAIVVSGEPTPTYQYLNKLVFLGLGLGLVAPLSKSVQRSAVPA